ncbi:molybdopterin-dependent oxidoreductase [Candidatus Entotheonella palauensis]|uniref:molybdopterin-dependent oxidoreductase n=1 Tax=Candidatus Entotheonella palauensis TaxID=93172 RepID=UPI000B7DE070|nr:molybdopterin cofactor-binding domain-containing protein [Candidatus Entotheonella palauensis]
MSDIRIQLTVNGQTRTIPVSPFVPLSSVLRDTLGLTGTKIGCEAGDCGLCTVRLNGEQVCACLVPAGQCEGADILTIEGYDQEPVLDTLRHAFLQCGAAQCGICTPGMLMAACDLLKRHPLSSHQAPSDQAIRDTLGGVLCRCTGYIKIIEAVAQAAEALRGAPMVSASEVGSQSVGIRMARTDGLSKVSGLDCYGADHAPADALWLRVVRSPHARAHFRLGDLALLYSRYPGLVRVLTADDVPGYNGFGVYPDIKDQPVLAPGEVRYRGEAVLALVGEREVVEAIDVLDLPIEWFPEPPVDSLEAARAEGAPALHAHLPDNVLARGVLERGDMAAAEREAAVVVEGAWETSFVEHAYLEPEAGYARRDGDCLEVVCCTQSPYMDRDDLSGVMGLAPEQIRIIPTACGGGFGGKLDISVQPLLAMACWMLNRPVRAVYGRIESMASSTKRHPATMRARAMADAQGRLLGFEFDATFNTGAYSSWGPTVAGRVPVHCTGPYRVPNVSAHTAAVFTHAPPAGAFRGFGTPQAAIAQELLYDELADKIGLDRLQFRLVNALRVGDSTPSGQSLKASAGLRECLAALEPDWRAMLADAEHHNRDCEQPHHRRGVGIACMWYGCGNTSMSNPSTIRVVLKPNGRFCLYNDAVDIGQGSTTIMVQICADAIGVPAALFDQIIGDTALTEDAGKTSASRQTFVSGKAAYLAGRELRAQLLEHLGVDDRAELSLAHGVLRAVRGEQRVALPLEQLAGANAWVAEGVGCFDPPTTPLDKNGQGNAYATYAFAAQICSVDVDCQLGTVKVRRIVAAHDVGKAINPTLIEGQIHGGIAQGLGMALMEEYIPGRTENLHDYLIPTIGDMPEIDIVLIEDPEPLGPFGAKGVGEPTLVPTPAAILSAIRHATGVTMRQVPVLPHRLLQAMEESHHNR